METVDVHLVELPTTVLSGGRPRLGLPQSAFRVYDESKRVDIAKFEEVKNLPLSVGVAVDNSASMEPRMKAAEKAAADFLTTVMRGNDKGFVVAFDSTPRVMQTWSRDTKDLLRALAKMQARDQTALYDAIVYSLYNFTGVRGQRALVVVTDGKDTSSHFTYEQALEYAHRSGVPLYAIGIGVRDLDYATRSNLSRLASETGGEAFFIGNIVDLAATYSAIAEELRSQYIIGFYPPEKPGTKWHDVSVQVDGGKAKTIRGYYP
jgi:Ca-activated chloride channel family protein